MKNSKKQLQELGLQIMIKEKKKSNNLDDMDNYCEECNKNCETVLQNLILIGYKICNSCRISKTIFPVQVILLIGSASILLITKVIDKNAIIKNDKNTTPKDLKFDFKFNTFLLEIIREAKIQN